MIFYNCLECGKFYKTSNGRRFSGEIPQSVADVLIERGIGMSSGYCGQICYEKFLKEKSGLAEQDITELLKEFEDEINGN